MKIDARKYSPEMQYEIRKQVICLREQGVRNKVLVKDIGISESRACKIWRNYLKEGSKAIKLGKRGRRTILTSEQEAWVKRALIDKTPDQLKLPFALWTREAVKLLIEQQFSLEMPVKTVGRYLKRWNFTPKKPVKLIYEQSPQSVKKWLDAYYPPIVSWAKAEKAEIYWGDKTEIQTGANRVRGFAPTGNKPVVNLVADKSHVSMISAINNRGKVRFMMYRDAMKSEILIRFMIRLTKDAGRKVFLILDNPRVHYDGKNINQWLEANKDRIEVFYLRFYPPELNRKENRYGMTG